MTTKIDNSYMSVTEEDGILSLIWKKPTAEMTDEDFKKAALQFVGALEELQSKKILVDMREFGYQLNPEIIAWRNENVIAAYNRIGVERFAFVSERPAVKQDDPANTFMTVTFQSSNEALNWLKE